MMEWMMNGSMYAPPKCPLPLAPCHVMTPKRLANAGIDQGKNERKKHESPRVNAQRKWLLNSRGSQMEVMVVAVIVVEPRMCSRMAAPRDNAVRNGCRGPSEW